MISTDTNAVKVSTSQLELPAIENSAQPDREFFRIPAARYDYLCARIAKLARRQAKLTKRGPIADTTPITVQKVSTEIEPPKCLWCDGLESTHRNGRCYSSTTDVFTPGAEQVFFICRVTGAAPHLAGHEFLATLQHENAGTILRTVPTAKIIEGELDRFRTVKPHCEHCKVRRNRKDSFVVRNTETRETLQVGRNCLGKYLGGANPKAVAALAELLIKAQAAGYEEEGWVGGHYELATSLPQFLTFCAAAIRVDGWTSRGAVRDGNAHSATVDHVWAVLFPAKDRHSQRDAAEFRSGIIDQDRQTAIRALCLGGARLITNTRLGDYEHNMRIALSSEYVNAKRAGLVGSLIAWYEREVGIAAQKKADREANKQARVESKHFGMVKERFEMTVTVTRVHDTENEFGVSHGHFFKTDDGNIAVWWTGTQRLDVGATYRIKGTVKKHDDYKGTQQTVLSRCKVIETLVEAV